MFYRLDERTPYIDSIVLLIYPSSDNSFIGLVKYTKDGFEICQKDCLKRKIQVNINTWIDIDREHIHLTNRYGKDAFVLLDDIETRSRWASIDDIGYKCLNKNIAQRVEDKDPRIHYMQLKHLIPEDTEV